MGNMIEETEEHRKMNEKIIKDLEKKYSLSKNKNYLYNTFQPHTKSLQSHTLFA